MRKQMDKVADEILEKESDYYSEYLESLFVEFFGGLEDKVGPFTSGELERAFLSALDKYTAI